MSASQSDPAPSSSTPPGRTAGEPDVARDPGPPVATGLLRLSTLFAQTAAAAYSTESWEVFHLHLATAVELLIKAVLARAHPSFIADARADFDSLLHLCGMGDRARTPEFVAAARTITVSEALARVGRVVDDYRQPGSRVRLLLDTRNGIIHAGHRSKAQGEAVLGEVAGYVDQLLLSLGVEATDYWGNSSAMVADHARRRLTAIEATYERRVQAAKDLYRARTSPMDEAWLAGYLAGVAPATPSEPFDAAPVLCPACRNPGTLYGSPEPTWEPDWDVADGEGYVAGVYVSAIRLTASGFDCRACGLSLNASLLTFAGLDQVTLTEDEFDLSAATTFFERELADDTRDDDWP